MNPRLKTIVKSLKHMLKQLPEFKGSIKCQEENNKMVLDIGYGGASLMFYFSQGGIYDPIKVKAAILSWGGAFPLEMGVIEETSYKKTWEIVLELLVMMQPAIVKFFFRK